MNRGDWDLIVEALEIMHGLAKWFSAKKRDKIAMVLFKVKEARKSLRTS